MSTSKVSVAIDDDELRWARSVARREGKSLSAVVTESLADRRRLAALRDVVDWMAEGELPLSKEELAAASLALRAPAHARPPVKKPAASRRR